MVERILGLGNRVRPPGLVGLITRVDRRIGIAVIVAVPVLLIGVLALVFMPGGGEGENGTPALSPEGIPWVLTGCRCPARRN